MNLQMTYSTSQLQSLLNRSNVRILYPCLTIISVGQVHVRDPEGTVAKIYRLIEVGASNITVSRRVRRGTCLGSGLLIISSGPTF